MTAEMLDWVCAYLERDEEVIVPIKKLWNEWHAAHGRPSLEAFTALVQADGRIEQLVDEADSARTEGLPAQTDEAYVTQSEAIGLYSGPQVKLKSRQITDEHVAHILQKQTERVILALDQVLESLPDDLGDVEGDEASDALSLIEQLREQLGGEGGPEDS